jgi:hypothetical protein
MVKRNLPFYFYVLDLIIKLTKKITKRLVPQVSLETVLFTAPKTSTTYTVPKEKHS